MTFMYVGIQCQDRAPTPHMILSDWTALNRVYFPHIEIVQPHFRNIGRTT